MKNPSDHLTAPERGLLLSELGWLHEDPKRVANILTRDEERKILKAGFVPRDLWEEIRKRL